MSIDNKRDLQPIQPILPLALMANGRRCLVVGAGKTGARKAESLLDVGAEVTVVAPTGADNLEATFANRKAIWLKRNFEDSDLDGIFLVFAATDDPEINSKVLNEARRRGVLCGIVDMGWQEGDFISPAVVRHEGVTFAVSTGGRSCRRSRMIKESLGRHVLSVSSADLFVLGVSHDCLPLDRRQAFHLAGERAELAGMMLTQVWGVHEFVLLNTCNRVELLAVTSDEVEIEPLLCRILGFDGLSPDESYVMRGQAAFRHVAHLLSGLLSQTPGENHIVSQVKDAFDSAESAGWAGSMMNEWLSSALHVSKGIRRSSRSLLHATEIEDLCLDYLAAQESNPAREGLAVLGSGSIGCGIVDRFLDRYPDAPLLWAYHQTRPEIPESWRERVRLVRLDSIREQLKSIRTVVCAMSSSEPVLRADDASCFGSDAGALVVDLGVPRNVAPEFAHMSLDIRIVDLDDLKHWYRREAADMSEVIRIADQVVDDHKDMYEKLVRGLRSSAL
jgi:glutamyl-tRNA reductase